MKVIIVGNGILASSIAFRLLEETNCEIGLIGPSERHGGATSAAAAMLNSFAEVESDTLANSYGSSYFGLSYIATQMWPDFERALINFAGSTLPSQCRQCQVEKGGCFSKGTYIVNNAASDSLDDRNYRAILSALQDSNEPYQEVDPGSIKNYNPDERKRALRAIYVPNEGWLNPKIVLEKLDNILRASSRVKIYDAFAKDLVVKSSKITEIALSSGETLSGDFYVLANGVGVTDLLRKTPFCRVIQPVFSGVGVSLEIKVPEEHVLASTIRTPNRGGGCGIYVVPYFKDPSLPRTNLIVGASNVVTLDPRYSGRLVSVAHLIHSAISEVNRFYHNAELVTVNVGNRPTSLDSFPLLGRVRGTNFSVATGTKRDGFHLSPLISKLIVDELVSGNNSAELEFFAPDRPPIRHLSRAASVQGIIDSKLSEAYQHGFQPASIFQDIQYREFWRDAASKLHDDYGAETWGIPSQMFGLYRDLMLAKTEYQHVFESFFTKEN